MAEHPATSRTRIPDVDALRRELNRYRSYFENALGRAGLVEAALPRIMATLALLPDGNAESRLLELGADPFLTTFCLEQVWPGGLTLASYRPGHPGRGSEKLIDIDGGPPRIYEFDTFNVETEEFPYPEASFDVVVFSELIEHLALNPVWALGEIHRVLRPGGHLIITTPNALSLERLDNLIRGGSRAEERYMPVFGYGARHNREWHAGELREVLETTGFRVEELVVRDLGTYERRERFRRAWARLVLRWWSRHPRQDHIFLRARRADVFHWRFPPRLYDHMHLYQAVRDPFIEMGVNDAIQCAGGWLPLEVCPENGGPESGQPIRRVNGENLRSRSLHFAIGYLRGRPGATRLAVRLCATTDAATPEVHGAIRICPPGRETEALGLLRFDVPAAAWLDVDVPLARSPLEREELEVHVGVHPGNEVRVRRLALE